VFILAKSEGGSAVYMSWAGGEIGEETAEEWESKSWRTDAGDMVLYVETEVGEESVASASGDGS